MRIIIHKYILSAFEADKMYETLIGLNWLWFFFLSMLPDYLVTGATLDFFQNNLGHVGAIAVLGTISILHVLALTLNILRLRQILLIGNVSILSLLGWKVIIALPIVSGGGFIIILGVLCSLTFFRITMRR